MSSLIPVIPLRKPDGQRRVTIPESFDGLRGVEEVIVAKLKLIPDTALYFMGIIDPNSEYGENISVQQGGLLSCARQDYKRRIIIPRIVFNDPDLDFLKKPGEKITLSLLPRVDGAVLAGRENDVIQAQIQLFGDQNRSGY